MTHVFEGKPDARQSDDVNMKTTRFRPKYRALTDEEKALHDLIKLKATELEYLIDSINAGKSSRYKSLAMTDLELAIMWAVKDLTS